VISLPGKPIPAGKIFTEFLKKKLSKKKSAKKKSKKK